MHVCFPCRFVGAHDQAAVSSHRPEQVFTVTGFRDWKHATGKKGILTNHDTCHSHKEAMAAWNDYMVNKRRGTTISERIDSSRSELIKCNQQYVKTVAEVLLLCCHQELATRAHDESEDSSNRGNLCEILDVVANHDDIKQQKLHHGQRNVHCYCLNLVLVDTIVSINGG